MGWTVYDSSGNLLSSIALVDNVVATAKIADDAVTYAKMQNLATADRVLGSASTGVIGEVQVVADMIATDAVTNVKVATGIDAVKIADGSVTSTEFQYINTLSSNAQTQLAAKQATIDSSARLNANLIHDGSVTNTEFGYISTLSSNAQTQLAAKQATIDSSARLDAASIGANGNVSNTEYGYLSGVTSDIQTQISAAGGAVVREGGDVGEESETSNSVALTSSAASISILAAETAIVRWSARKTSGAGESGTCGVKIYADATTTICSPTTASTTNFPWGSANSNRAENGPAGFFISGRGADYLNSSSATVIAGYGPVGGGESSVFAGQKMQVDDDYPAGEITRIDILVIGGGTITVSTDFLNAYSFTGS